MSSKEILKIGEIRNNLSPAQAAATIGGSLATYYRRKAKPGTFTLAEVRALTRRMRLTDEELLTLVKGE